MRAPSRWRPIRCSRAKAAIRCISAKSKSSPWSRCTGNFIEISADRGRDAGFLKAGDLDLDLGKGKGRALRSERDEGQTAQLLRAVSGIVVDMAFALDEHPMAARCEKTQRQMVGERTAGQKERHLFAEQRRHSLLELSDDPSRENSSAGMPRSSTS